MVQQHVQHGLVLGIRESKVLVLSPLLSLFFGFDFKTSTGCFCIGNHGVRGTPWVASFATFSLAQPASGWGRAPGVWAGLWNAPWLGDRGISPPFTELGWARLVQSNGSDGSNGSGAFPCPELQLMPSPARCPLLLPRLLCLLCCFFTENAGQSLLAAPQGCLMSAQISCPIPCGKSPGVWGLHGTSGDSAPLSPCPMGPGEPAGQSSAELRDGNKR